MVFESLFESAKEKRKECKPSSLSIATSETKRKRKRSRPKKKKASTPELGSGKPLRKKNIDKRNNRKTRPSKEAIELSSKLKELSTQKRLQDILELYHDEANDNIRDSHHACIVVDCCGRCGCVQKGEEIVENLKKDGEEVNVQTITALLKGYTHSGMMDKAAALYIEMSEKENKRDRPNIRTLNTMLRGCMWASSSYKFGATNQLTSEYIWPSPSSHIIPDTSSYEYSISILSQALRCDDAKKRLDEFMKAFKVRITKDKTGEQYAASDASVLETLGVSLFNIARAYALMSDTTKAMEFANHALNVVASVKSLNQGDRSNGAQNKAGGKRAWKSSRTGKCDENDQSRRVESNSLFRAHKLNELESDTRMILNSLTNTNGQNEHISHSLAKFLLTRVLYFSGGGTTDLSASSFDHGEEGHELNVNNERLQLFDSLWMCFGLCKAMEKEFPLQTFETTGPNSKVSDSIDFAKILRKLKLPKSYVLHNDGTIDFDFVFSQSRGKGSKRPLNIELGSGFGEWIVGQALNTPNSDYVAVELRSDRVGQMFAKSFLSKKLPIRNLCCVGSECGSFLRTRVKKASVSKIFVNHPEPPTQTFGANNLILKKISEGGEEPAHMLNSQTLISAARSLDKERGKLIIVTDNMFYANLICASLIKVMNANEGMFVNDTLDGMRQIKEFKGKSRDARVVLYEGKPNELIDHKISEDFSRKGSTYFDRLWRKGAGNHAETHKRFVICMRRSKLNGNNSQKSHEKNAGKKKRRRSQIQQEKRNERRLKRRSSS